MKSVNVIILSQSNRVRHKFSLQLLGTVPNSTRRLRGLNGLRIKHLKTNIKKKLNKNILRIIDIISLG